MKSPTAKKPAVGKLAPTFMLRDETGTMHDLTLYRGKQNVVLVFYPGDDTPGCTMQLCAIRDQIDGFTSRQAVVFGINHADAESHRRFIEKYGLKNNLLVDEGRAVARQYGAVGSIFGHETTKRTVAFVDRRGVLQYYQRGMPSNGELFEVLDWVNKQTVEVG